MFLVFVFPGLATLSLVHFLLDLSVTTSQTKFIQELYFCVSPAYISLSTTIFTMLLRLVLHRFYKYQLIQGIL